MFRLVLDVLGDGREVGQLVNNVVNDVNHTLIGVVLVCGENEGWGTGLECGGFLVPYIYGREGVCVCTCVGVNAMDMVVRLCFILPGGTVGYPAQPGLTWRNHRLSSPTRINLEEP